MEEEHKILNSIQEQKVLMTVKELATGITYNESLITGWDEPLILLSKDKKGIKYVEKRYLNQTLLDSSR